MLINACRKLGTVRKQLLQKTLALQRDREALLLKCQPISYSLAQMLLMSSYKFYSAFGCWDPVKVECIVTAINEISTCALIKNADFKSFLNLKK